MSKAADRNQRQLLELQKLPGNDVCADCKARNPRWASWDLGIFLCLQCAGLHRKMGTHISKVKSLTMDTWTREQVDHMRANGNLKSNYYFNPDDRLNPPPASVDEGEKEWQLERFIRDKYEYKAFIGATPLGPPPVAPTGFIPSSAFGQQLAAEGAGGASSSGYKPPEPLRPQQTGFVPSSAFGQQLQNEGGGGAGGSMGGEYKQPEPLRPQPTGFVPSSRFGQQLAREQQHGAVGTAGGLGTSTSSFGASSSNTTNNALPSSPFSLNPIANVPSPSPSAMLYASPVSSPSASLSTTNPFYSSFSMSGMNASLPARAPSAGGGGMGTPIGMGGGTNPFFNTAPVGGLKPQATGYGYGQGFLGGPSPTASGYGTPTGQQGNQGVNPFFGGGTANVSAGGMGEFGQLPRHWG